MESIKNFLNGKKAGWYVSAAAALLAAVTLIVSCARGGNVYSDISGVAIAMLVIGIITNIAVLVKDFGIGAFVPFVFYAVTLGVLANTEMLFLSNVMTKIDGNSLDAAWLTFAITLVLTIGAALAACIMNLSKPKEA